MLPRTSVFAATTTQWARVVGEAAWRGGYLVTAWCVALVVALHQAPNLVATTLRHVVSHTGTLVYLEVWDAWHVAVLGALAWATMVVLPLALLQGAAQQRGGQYAHDPQPLLPVALLVVPLVVMAHLVVWPVVVHVALQPGAGQHLAHALPWMQGAVATPLVAVAVGVVPLVVARGVPVHHLVGARGVVWRVGLLLGALVTPGQGPASLAMCLGVPLGGELAVVLALWYQAVVPHSPAPGATPPP